MNLLENGPIRRTIRQMSDPDQQEHQLQRIHGAPSWLMRKLRRCRSIIALLVRKRRSISLMIILMIVTVVGWNVYAFFSHPLPGATVVSVFGRSGARPLERR